jgi:hypothetical protein
MGTAKTSACAFSSGQLVTQLLESLPPKQNTTLATPKHPILWAGSHQHMCASCMHAWHATTQHELRISEIIMGRPPSRTHCTPAHSSQKNHQLRTSGHQQW